MRTNPRRRVPARPRVSVSTLHASLVVVLLGATLSALLTSPAGAEESDGAGQMVLVLDASGSMKEPHGDGRTRFQAAVSAMRQVVGSLPDDVEVGLRIYGSRIPDGPGSCKDSELVVPVGPTDTQALRSALGKARPLGNTPIAYSLEQAATDLPDSGSRTIVLVSDGEESCGGDPCKVARDLSQQGLDLHVDVVGFQVDAAARNQLTCVAQAGRGTFYDAPDADALVSQLSRLSARAARAYAPQGIPVEGADVADGAPSSSRASTSTPSATAARPRPTWSTPPRAAPCTCPRPTGRPRSRSATASWWRSWWPRPTAPPASRSRPPGWARSTGSRPSRPRSPSTATR